MTGSIAAFSYTSAALAFLIMSGLLLTRWRARRFSRALLFACLVSACWAGGVVLRLTAGPSLFVPLDLLELARSASWTYFLLTLATPPPDRDVHARADKSPMARLVLALYAVMAATTLYAALRLGFAQSENGGLILLTGRILAAVIGMLLVEKVFINTSSEDRWSIKFACIGIGSLFAYDFYIYSDALLFRAMNAEVWVARGMVNALIVPLLGVSIARDPQWSLRLSVSRQMMFHSATISGSALYLLIMAAAAYYMRYSGGAWGPIVGAAFLFAAVVLLLVTLFSGAFRAWLKIFISKHFYTYNYDYREEWLRFTRTLSEPGPGLEQRAVRALANLVESPAGVMFARVSADAYAPVAGWNIASGDARQPVDTAFIRLLQEKHWVIDLNNFSGHGVEDIALPEWLAAIPNAWLIVPLVLQADLVGFIVLTQSRTEVRLNWEVLDLLKVAGSQAAGNLAQKHAADALMVARQFESYNRMSTFVVHDLKNLVSQLSLLVANAERHRDSAEFQQDMRDTVSHSVDRMKILLQKFSRSAIAERSSAILIEQAVQQAMAAKSAGLPRPSFEVLESGLVVEANPSRLERVIGHLIQNAMEATPRDGSIRIVLARQGASAVLELADSGQGMSEDFIRDRLFRPFESTKAAGMGIGVFESREYIQELGGSLDVSSQPDVGTTFRITLPLHRRRNDDGDSRDYKTGYRASNTPA